MAMMKTFMDFVRFALTVTRPFSFTVLDTIYRSIFGPKPVLPPIDNEILLIPASELAEKIRKKQLKAEDVMKAYIKRIEEVEPYVHACIDERFEEALKEAKDVDKFLLNTIMTEEEIQNHTPLLGVPFSCKENVGVKGLAQNSAMYNAKDRKAPEDGVCTALYRKAGAIPVVVTNVPEFCSWWETQNVPFGRTFNPYDNVRIAGGSSGGEGSILGYAGTAIGIGNDLAGSIRMPSAFNGIYGHKPSPGLISNEGCWPPDDEGLKNFVGTGPMCRYAKDLPLITNILSESKIKFDREVNFRKIRIYYMEQFPGYLLKPIPEITAAIQKARKYFEDTFSNKPTEINIPEMRYALEIWESKLLEASTVSMRECIESVSLLQEFIKYLFNQSKHTLPVIYYASVERRKKDSDYHKFISMFNSIKEKLDFILENDGILLLPTHPEPAPHHLLTIPKYPNQAYTCIFNVLGYPSTQIPAGFSNGLPIGLQIIGAMNNDCLCISTAVELEKIFGEPPQKPHHLLNIPKYPNQAYTCIFNVLGYPSPQIPAGFCNGLPIGLQIIEPTPRHFLTIPKYPNQAYTCIFNILGYPSTQIPAGFTNGLPIGLQITGAMKNDYLCISTAVELEKIFGSWSSPSKIVI